MEDIFPSSFEKISLVVISVKFLPQKIIYYHVIGRRAERGCHTPHSYTPSGNGQVTIIKVYYHQYKMYDVSVKLATGLACLEFVWQKNKLELVYMN